MTHQKTSRALARHPARSCARLMPASALVRGPSTIVVRLPDRTIRSRVVLIEHHPQGGVCVAFASGDIVTLSPRSMVGCVDARTT